MTACGSPPGQGRQSASALPRQLDIDLFCYCRCVIDLHSEIADRTLDFCMPQQKPLGPHTAGAAIDERRLGPRGCVPNRSEFYTGQPVR
jgi:hypothetical protein